MTQDYVQLDYKLRIILFNTCALREVPAIIPEYNEGGAATQRVKRRGCISHNV